MCVCGVGSARDLPLHGIFLGKFFFIWCTRFQATNDSLNDASALVLVHPLAVNFIMD